LTKELSKTQQALIRVANGEKAPTIAKDLGISSAVIYAAMKKRVGKTICPCCGQIVREGFQLAEKT
jgi:hypothetical protein